jgi:hypothetical protein
MAPKLNIWIARKSSPPVVAGTIWKRPRVLGELSQEALSAKSPSSEGQTLIMGFIAMMLPPTGQAGANREGQGEVMWMRNSPMIAHPGAHILRSK